MKKVLIIEDNGDNMELMRFILQANGYETVCAKTGQEGIEKAVSDAPDFIILDIQLPDIDGYDVLKRIRSSETGRDVPVIAMTSYAMTGDREQMLAAGCNGYIEKPINPRNVLRQIQRIIGVVE